MQTMVIKIVFNLVIKGILHVFIDLGHIIQVILSMQTMVPISGCKMQKICQKTCPCDISFVQEGRLYNQRSRNIVQCQNLCTTLFQEECIVQYPQVQSVKRHLLLEGTLQHTVFCSFVNNWKIIDWLFNINK